MSVCHRHCQLAQNKRSKPVLNLLGAALQTGQIEGMRMETLISKIVILVSGAKKWQIQDILVPNKLVSTLSR